MDVHTIKLSNFSKRSFKFLDGLSSVSITTEISFILMFHRLFYFLARSWYLAIFSVALEFILVPYVTNKVNNLTPRLLSIRSGIHASMTWSVLMINPYHLIIIFYHCLWLIFITFLFHIEAKLTTSRFSINSGEDASLKSTNFLWLSPGSSYTYPARPYNMYLLLPPNTSLTSILFSNPLLWVFFWPWELRVNKKRQLRIFRL